MATITRETVEAVFKYKKKYPEMTMEELAVLCKTSSSSVSNIMNGVYNHLLEDTKKEEKKGVVSSDIPYEEYKKLVACELAIDEIFGRSLISINDEDELFIDYKYLFGVLKRYFPEKYADRVKQLSDIE